MQILTPRSLITQEQNLAQYQLMKLGFLAFAFVGVIVIQFLFPTFFVYPYFTWGGWEAVMKFWPLFLYGGALTILINRFGRSDWLIRTSQNRELFFWEFITSTLAGLWEELAYRWIFICYAMLAIALLNTAIAGGVGLALAIACALAAWWLWDERQRIFSILAVAVGILGLLFVFYGEPMSWFYGLVVLVIHFTTFTLMDPVLYGNHEPLFIFGAVLANGWFRDGHKYQGPLGYVNSWYCGMVLLYAAMTYGLWVAIVVHALYDILICFIRFIMQRTA